MVAAMGNDGVFVNDYDPSTYQPFDENYRFPASYPEVIGVSGIVQDENGADAFYANSNYGPAVDLTAPTVTPSTAIDGYEVFGGTSASCPHVAGVAALVLKQLNATDPESGLPDQVKGILTETAEELANLTEDQQGSGLVDAAAAVAACGSTGAPQHYRLSPSGKLSVTWGELKDR